MAQYAKIDTIGSIGSTILAILEPLDMALGSNFMVALVLKGGVWVVFQRSGSPSGTSGPRGPNSWLN